MKSIVICSGYYDPVHVGHLEYLKLAKELGNKLWVIVNNDKQAKLKKGKSFMNEKERMMIMKSIKGIDKVILSFDEDRSVSETLKTIREILPNETIIFANGGDVISNCREEETCKKLGIKTIYGLGNKIQSSSWLTRIKTK